MKKIINKRVNKNNRFFQYPKVYASIISISIIMAIGFIVLDKNNTLTGFVVVSKGGVASIGNQKVADPNYGVAKGTLDFTLTDGDTVVGTSSGIDYTIYFSRDSIEDLELIKASASSFTGALSDIDPDGEETRCSAGSYTTSKMYYDEDNDNTEDPSEKEVYAVTTDANGCFAIKVKSGNNNIYG